MIFFTEYVACNEQYTLAFSWLRVIAHRQGAKIWIFLHSSNILCLYLFWADDLRGTMDFSAKTVLPASFLIASKGDDNEVKKECVPLLTHTRIFSFNRICKLHLHADSDISAKRFNYIPLWILNLYIIENLI